VCSLAARLASLPRNRFQRNKMGSQRPGSAFPIDSSLLPCMCRSFIPRGRGHPIAVQILTSAIDRSKHILHMECPGWYCGNSSPPQKLQWSLYSSLFRGTMSCYSSSLKHFHPAMSPRLRWPGRANRAGSRHLIIIRPDSRKTQRNPLFMG
jgi:hypothetical protein